jgi:V/A-type H+-transporting ATPase subunit C
LSWTRSLKNQLYAVVRAYGAKGTLLPYATLVSLAEASDMDDLVNRLKTTIYRTVLNDVKPPYKASTLEFAFRKHLIRLHHLFLTTAESDKILWEYFNKYLAFNIKLILKSIVLEQSFEQARELLDLEAETLVGRRDLVARLLSAKSLPEAAQLLKGELFGPEVQLVSEIYPEQQDLQVIDLVIDRQVYRRLANLHAKSFKSKRDLLTGHARSLHKMVSMDVDSYNVLAILRGKQLGLSLQRLQQLVVEPMFNLVRDDIEKMIRASSIDEALEVLRHTQYGRMISLEGEDPVKNLEETFASQVLEQARRTFVWNEMSPAVMLATIKLKEDEVRRLSAIAFGVEQKLGSRIIIDKALRGLPTGQR